MDRRGRERRRKKYQGGREIERGREILKTLERERESWREVRERDMEEREREVGEKGREMKE